MLIMASTITLATPVAAPDPITSVVPTPAANTELGPVLGTPIPEAEALALVVAATKENRTLSTIGEQAHDSLDKRSYVATCTGCVIDLPPGGDVNLVCSCRNKAGGTTWSALNLRNCLANHWGVLVWEYYGNFKASCPGVLLLDGSVMGTWCRPYLPDNTVSYVYTQIDLNAKIHNWDGILGCMI
ncbi:hypothetical protein QBC37DRAFT_397313 [Rhypophila decipiens]|uniref:Cyanovirin-N domain-containing protein n=1 Tax=Rhypophila decipiens TaxID=261697 RepID=A0AAN6YDQ4_9PEZI|nr:hypothetical protein QBC37DRAFT_397313 [Rhypophila decipiens]